MNEDLITKSQGWYEIWWRIKGSTSDYRRCVQCFTEDSVLNRIKSWQQDYDLIIVSVTAFKTRVQL